MPLLTFGVFALDPDNLQLWRGDAAVPLEPQPARLLALLVSRAGTMVSRGEIVEQLWGAQTHVSYGDGIEYAIRQIRIALGDDPKDPIYIETIPRRVYRFAAAVEPRRDHRTVAKRTALSWVAAAGGAALVILEQLPNRHHEYTVQLLGALHALLF